MILYFRLLWSFLTTLFKKQVPLHGPVSRKFLILPLLDSEFGVLNAGRYFNLCELVQAECNFRSGLIPKGLPKGITAVLGGNVITYKKPIKVFSILTIRCEVLGWNDKYAVWENRFFDSKGRLCALGYTQAFIRKKGKAASVKDLFPALDIEAYERVIPSEIEGIFEGVGREYKRGSEVGASYGSDSLIDA